MSLKISKLRNRINGVWEFRYDTICSQNFRINRITGKEIVRGGPKLYTDTDTDTHTHTHTHTYGGPFYVFFCENAETRLKNKESKKT